MHCDINDIQSEHDIEDAEKLPLSYQLVQRNMENKTVNLSDAWYLEHQMEEWLKTCHLLPEEEMDEVQQLWKRHVAPAQTRLQALCVVTDPRIWAGA